MTILSHYRAGSGAIAVETREENRFLQSVLAELPTSAEVAVTAAPSGSVCRVRLANNGVPVFDRSNPLIQSTGMAPTIRQAYEWAANAPGRVLVVLDWHRLVNSPGHWRWLLEALPGIRSPKGVSATDSASLIVYVSPTLTLDADNPLRGNLPVVQFDPPGRDALREVANRLLPLPPNGEGEKMVDALCGLTADSAEQACAETIIGAGGQWDQDRLRNYRRQALREGGLELWPHVEDLGGLGGLRAHFDSELIPWIRDPQLSIRRVLCAGIPGVGKSYCSRWLSYRLGCECARVSIPALKAGIVGASEANLRRCLRTIDAMAAHAPLVIVMDEIDTIARDGLDGGTSAGMFAELLTWLQESQSQAIVIATLNRLDKLDAALESRFQSRLFFDLPTAGERKAVAGIHYGRLGCSEIGMAAKVTAQLTDGYSSREIAEHICPSVARLSKRVPTADVIESVIRKTVPASRTQAAQLEAMRQAASTLRRANDQDDQDDPHPSRRVS